jgi:antitoxin Phd
MKQTTWQLQEAKNKLSEVLDCAQTIGPQEITRHGKKTAVILSMNDFNRMLGKKEGLIDFFKKSPLCGLDLDRQKDISRDVAL